VLAASPRVRRYEDDLGIYGLPGDVSAWDVRFDAGDPADLEPLGDGRFRIRIHTEPGLVDGRVVVRSTDGILGVPLRPVSAGRFVQWSATIGPLTGTAGISFAFMSAESGRPVYVTRWGVAVAVERLDRWQIDAAQPPVDTPDWVKGAVIYQIFPERFENGDPGNDPPGTVAWGSEPSNRVFQGGDLDGIIQRLDHIASLGVDALYLNPIFESPSTHKYDTTNYFEVDPAFGGDDALRRLVAAAHARDIRVVLDASFNHVHPRFFAFADVVAKGRKSHYVDWFVIHDWPPRIKVRRAKLAGWMKEALSSWEERTGVVVEELSGSGPAIATTYESWFGVPTMPRLALHNPEPRAHALEAAQYWLREFDIDGWRMDVARYVDDDFWPEFRRVCRAVKPDAYLLAEIVGDPTHWLSGDAFDATMNYSFRSLALGFFARGYMDGAELLDRCSRLYGRHPLAVTLVNHDLLGSHDTPRFRTVAGGALWRLELATVFQMTFPGAPGVYYGDEIGLQGGDDPQCRGAMPWDRIGRKPSLIPTITELAALRRRSPALRLGEWAPLAATANAVAYERRLGRAGYVIGINRSTRAATLDVPGSSRTLWGSGEHRSGKLHIAGRSAVITRR
jgi:cyclomaltodextrinase